VNRAGRAGRSISVNAGGACCTAFSGTSRTSGCSGKTATCAVYHLYGLGIEESASRKVAAQERRPWPQKADGNASEETSCAFLN
jgi:hypothetical protein